MVKYLAFTLTWSLFLVVGCQQQASSTRSKPAVAASSSVATGTFKILGDYKDGTVKGYIKDYATTYKLSGKDGEYLLPAMPAGKYELWMTADGVIEDTKVALAASIEVGDGSAIGPFTLVAAASIKGTIKADATRLAGIKVLIPGTDFETVPASDGSFAMTGLPAASMVLLLSEVAGEITRTDLTTASSTELTIPEIDLTKADDGTTPVIDKPTTTKIDDKLVGGSIVLNDGVVKTNLFTVPVKFNPPEGATEVLMSESIELTGSWQAIPESYSHTFKAQGYQNLYAKYRDADGAESEQVYGTVDINTSLPAAGVLKLTSGSTNTATRIVSLALTASGVDGVRFAFSQADLANATWRSFSTVISNFDLGTDAEGQRTVWFQLRSEYGVVGNAQSQNFTIYKTGPTIASSATKTGKASFNNRNVVLVVTPGTVPLDVKYLLVSCNGTTFDKLNFNTQTNEATVDILTSKAGCTTTEGLRTLQLKLEDSLGNAGTAVSQAVTYDITPPASPTVTQANGSYSQPQAFTVSGTAVANSTIVITGATADVTTAADGSGNWSTFVSLKLNQANNLVIKAQDEALNNSAAVNRTIYHDSIAPALKASPSVKITGESLVLDFELTESATAVVDYGTSVAYGSQKAQYTAAALHTIALPELLQNTVYHFRITLTDIAGNVYTTTDDTRRTYIDKSAQPDGNEVWDQTVTPYYLSGSFRINAGTRVRIKKGVTIAMESGTQIWVLGELIAEGTASEPVKFTTNNPNPAPGDWDRIEFNDTSAAAYVSDYIYDGGSRFDFVIAEYGGANGTSILVKQRSFFMANSTVRHSSTAGVEVKDVDGTGSIVFRRNTFESNAGGAFKVDAIDELTVGQKLLLADNTIRSNSGSAVNVNRYGSFSAKRNLFENGSGLKLRSVNASFENNVFSNLPLTFSVNADPSYPLDLDANRNAFVNASYSNGTLLEDSPSLNGTEGQYNLSFTENTVHNYKATATGASLIELDHPDDEDVAYKSYATADFSYNNFINNNIGLSNRYTMLSRAFRIYDDIMAENNYWGNANQLTVQQLYLYDFTDNNVYRFIDHQPILTSHRTAAPIAPPLNLAVTSPAAGSATLSWTVNDESDARGYRIYYSETSSDLLAGTGATQGSSMIDTESGAVSCTTNMGTKSCTLTGLTTGKTYYFSVTAYDAGGKLAATFTEPGPVNTATDEITLTAHGYRDGQRVRVSTADTLPGGLSASTNYWITYVDANTVKLRTTEAAGAAVDLTAAGDGTITITPNFPMKAGSYGSVVNATVNSSTDVITSGAAHGLASGVRGTFSSIGTNLGLDTTSEFYVTVANATNFKVSRNGETVSPVDIGLTNGYRFGSAEIDISANTFTIQSHELKNNETVQLTTSGALPSPLATGNNYYVVNATAHTFQLADAPAGLPIDLTNTGSDGLLVSTITPTSPGAGLVTFVPNYPDMARRDYQLLGNESWFATPVSVTVN